MSKSDAGEYERSDEKMDLFFRWRGKLKYDRRIQAAQVRVRQLPHRAWRRQRVVHPFRKYVGLNIGCYAGVRTMAAQLSRTMGKPKRNESAFVIRNYKQDLTYALHDFLEEAMLLYQPEISLIGVDVDPNLIEKARERNPRPDHVTFECVDFLSEDYEETLRRCLTQFNKTRFDVVFCYAITMWIHLHHGDDGLKAFLRKVCELAEMIVVELQPWQSYKDALAFGVFSVPVTELKYHIKKYIEDILRKCNFRRVTVTASDERGRVLLIYERKHHYHPTLRSACGD